MLRLSILLIIAHAGCGAPHAERVPEETAMTDSTYVRPSTDELAQKLTRMQFMVTQRDGTEPPFRNEYWDHHDAGLYVDVTTGEPLFSSRDKFDSGTGWPSFTRPIAAPHVVEHRDVTHGMVRVEVRSKAGDAHLGHVFDDGPAPTGLRYCINSASLRFVPAAELVAQGYGAYAAAFGVAAAPVEAKAAVACATDGTGCATTTETAVLAGGCFWGMQELLREIPGVIETDVGYDAGAESVRIVFDPAQLSYADLLEHWYFRMHDPTTANRQGNDVGPQYRSAIFAQTPAQETIAAEVIAKVDASQRWPGKIVTKVEPAGAFTLADEGHQDYLQKHPDGYTCHFLRGD